MRRREFIALLTAAPIALPLGAPAQQPAKEARIGFLFPSDPVVTRHYLDAFLEGMRAHGYVEGQNLKLERRYAEGRIERLPALAAELVKLDPQVIVTVTEPAIAAAKNATQRIPIVMANSSDPVGTKLVASLARPGGNVTGLSVFASEVSGKRLEILKEVLPLLSRAVWLWSPDSEANALERAAIAAAAEALRVELHPIEVRQLPDLEPALSKAAAIAPDALLLPAVNPIFFVMRSRIAAFALAHRLPSMAPQQTFVEDGALMSYGPNVPDMYRTAADYVVKILNGAKPADLPVAQPIKYELVVNMKTAKALGITFPRTILERADEVIE